MYVGDGNCTHSTPEQVARSCHESAVETCILHILIVLCPNIKYNLVLPRSICVSSKPPACLVCGGHGEYATKGGIQINRYVTPRVEYVLQRRTIPTARPRSPRHT